MVVETMTTFDVGDLACVKIRCPKCKTALEVLASEWAAVERFRQRVTSRDGVRCSHCDGAPILLRLESEFANEAHESVNGRLAQLVLGMLRASVEAAEPDRVQVQFAIGRAVRGAHDAGGS